MKIEVYENEKAVDASVLCNNTYEFQVNSIDTGAYNGTIELLTIEGDLRVKIVCFNVDDWCNSNFDCNQWSRVNDFKRDDVCKIEFGQCKNGKPFIRDVYKRVSRCLPIGQWEAEDDNAINEDYGVTLTEYVKC